MKSQKITKGLVLTALFAALISVGCFMVIPLPGGVPIVLQDFLAKLSGMLLGPLYGPLAVIIFLLLGIIGLPVYSGRAGIQILLKSPTCGFLWGYVVSALVSALILRIFLPQNKEHSNARQWTVISISSVVATIILFILGVIGFMFITKSGLEKALAVAVIPFIPGNIIKTILSILLTKKFRPIINNYIN